MDDLFLAGRKLANRFVNIDVRLDFTEHGAGAPAHLRAVKPAGTIRQIAKAKIFGDTQVRTEREFLVHYGDAKLTGDQWIGRVNQFAVEMDFAFVRRVNAGKNPAEGAFARAVLADERVATAALNTKAYTVQREHAGEAFGNVFEDEKRHFVLVRETR